MLKANLAPKMQGRVWIKRKRSFLSPRQTRWQSTVWVAVTDPVVSKLYPNQVGFFFDANFRS
jgi:hypothetical protein